MLTLALGLCAAGAFAQDAPLTLNEKQYFEKRGLNVLVFTNEYNGMFFDEKTAGLELIHHGVRTVTAGAVRLSPTPEQWDQIPKVVDRKVDAKTNTIEVTLRYEAFGFDSRLVVAPDGAGFKVAVFVDKPVPAELEGRAGLNLEFRPSQYWERTYLADGKAGIFPRYPAGPTASLPPERKIAQFEGHSTFDLHGHPDYVETLPLRRLARRCCWPPRTPSASSRSGPCRATCSCSTAATSRRTAGSSCARCWRRRPRARWRSGMSSRTRFPTGPARRSSASRRPATTLRSRSAP